MKEEDKQVIGTFFMITWILILISMLGL